MRVGTKSLLFGVHQFAIHPLVVLIAWVNLYGWPSWKELICIFVHDWGYWGKPNMDGEEGESHPELGAKIAGKLFDRVTWDEFRDDEIYSKLVLYHSRHYAKNAGAEPSKLCWADKLSIKYEPWWLYLPRAWASGELAEYRQLAAKHVPLSASHREWYRWVQGRLAKLAEEQRGDAVPYMNKERRGA